MRVFVAGATGAIGRPLVAQLVAAGHEVTGSTRSAERAAALERAGARAAVCDVFDEPAFAAAVRAARPEVVVHQLTSLPAALDPRRAGVFEATNRLRRDGTRAVVAAARAAGARRVVAQSIAFLYAPDGDWVKPEEAPVATAGGQFGGAVAAALELERQVLEAGIEGVVLRYGFLYGPGTAYASDGFIAGEVRRRRFPVLGRGEGRTSFVHASDAAAATVAALERGASGIYNVCDDEPAPQREWLPAYAAALDAPRPLRIPAWIAGLVAGRDLVRAANSMRGASNAKARSQLGWEPALPSWRHGFSEALDRAPEQRR